MAKTVIVDDAPKFGMKDKIGYALGDFGCNLSFVMVSTYFMVFYVTVMGISPVHFGFIALASRVWDGLNDIFVGSMVDRLRPKPGKSKFKTWMFYGSILLIFATIIMFTPIEALSYGGRLAMCMGSYALWTLVYTAVNVPYGSMASVITTDGVERAELSKYRALGSLLGNVPAGVVLPLVLYNAQSGDPIFSRFIPTAIVMGLMGTVCIQACAKMCTERIVRVEEPTDTNQSRGNFFKTFFSAMSSRPMIGLIIATCALLMLLQSNNATNQYVFMLHYQRTDLLSLTMMLSYIPQILMMIFLTPLVKKIGKKNLITYPFIGVVAVAAFMMITPMDNPYVWIACQFFIGLLQGAFVMLMWALISDIIDYMEARTGRREEGTVYSSVTLFRKFASGFGQVVIGTGLSAVGYNETVNVAQQAAGVGSGVKTFAALLLLIGGAIIFCSMKFIYNLDDEKMKEVEAKLNHEPEVETEAAMIMESIAESNQSNEIMKEPNA
ncbi:MFS transporter [Enterococcus gilvus]|uniref:Sugar (Glycoside-Pentoside-Hexuronide) transporter n=1 Tax=Enterococcus gilvus ATCC BAA-350 TaxID=1158614 RepID=R2VCK9_9ENTE|nr:glycoside-pentoside-hexuronide (GPH):cation symporter [Enterococcus gilvus]EOI55420.1 sugar (Glycoside-Pentoside-Hexuronide) transporter [Enterococcus gilvus ATCC BAA-350]EOW82037.1 hypothetical protein I592_01338 [Enterococcus gilvus ATCC BAA-350]OJG43066.1 sugar (Glycoside-Pentoside-Hexuronide) transporter [Enterococcus gilvus]